MAVLTTVLMLCHCLAQIWNYMGILCECTCTHCRGRAGTYHSVVFSQEQDYTIVHEHVGVCSMLYQDVLLIFILWQLVLSLLMLDLLTSSSSRTEAGLCIHVHILHSKNPHAGISGALQLLCYLHSVNMALHLMRIWEMFLWRPSELQAGVR